MDLDNENPWEGILSSTMFAIWSMVHTTSQHTLSHLVGGETNWQFIKQRKQALINIKKIVIINLICTTLETKSYKKSVKIKV